MKFEKGPEGIREKAKESEYAAMRARAERSLANGLSPENIKLQDMITAAEHWLIGSTIEGRAYYPNVPLAVVAGISLEKVNAARAEMNEPAIEAGQIVRRGGTVANVEKSQVHVRLLPLREADISNEEPLLTMQALELVDVYHEPKEAAPPEIAHKMLEKIIKGQAEAQELLAKNMNEDEKR